MASITLNQITKSFGAKEVIKNIDFEVADGEFLVLLGPSGCGKSTLLRMLAGLETISSGEINRTAKILALTPMLDQFPRTLSGGQRQRVALGRAMVRQPEVFLMDEPLSNLDAKLRTSMRAEISKLHQDIGGTFVYVTHDQVEAMTMGSKIALMRDGVVQQLGSSREIYTDPANVYVARFIGTPPMNLIEIEQADETQKLGPVALPLPALLATAAAKGGRKILMGIRPNAITLAATIDQTGVTGKIVMVEHVGAESIIAVKLDHARTAHLEDGELDAVMVTQSGYSELRSGDAVSVSFNLSEAVLFSPETGQRLR